MSALAHSDLPHDLRDEPGPVAEGLSPEPHATPVATLVATEDNPIPPGAVVGYFDGQDLTRLRYARWAPTAAPTRGTVCLFTGRAEFIEKYFETVGDLRARGFHVAIMDWRGQGGSARMLGNPLKGHTTTFDQYIADVHLFMREVVLPDCPGPYFGLAHSMGGNVLMQVLSRRGHWFDRAVLCAPMLDLAGQSMPLRGLRRIAEIACYAGLAAMCVPGGSARIAECLTFEGNPCTSDPHRFARNLRVCRFAPELTVGAPTIGWFHAAARAMEVVTEPEFPSLIRTPTLMVAAGNDRIVSTPAIEIIGRGLRGGGTVIVDGARHELLQERDWLREQFLAAFDAFVPGTGT